MTARVDVSLPALSAAVDEIAARIAGIEAQLARLRADLAPMVATWTGSAASAYQSLQQQWDDAAAGLQASLTDLHGIVARAHTRYGHAEDTNVRIWPE